MGGKLTKRTIPALELPQRGYRLVWDEDLPNFGVRITAGGARSYVVQHRIHGMDRRKTIARFDVMSPDEARRLAREYLGKIAAGKDPIAEKASNEAAAVTLGTAFEAYLKARKDLKERTISDMQNAMEDLGWSKRRVTTILPDDVERRHAELGSRSHARANLTMRYLRAILNFAAAKYRDAHGRSALSENPVKQLSKIKAWYRIERRRTVIKEHELKPWVTAVLALKNTDARDYFMMVLLTGLRKSESMNLKWSDYDDQAATITIPDPKNRTRFTLPLSDYLVSLLDSRWAKAKKRKESNRQYVFQTERGRLHNLRFAMAEVEHEATKALRKALQAAGDSKDTEDAEITFCMHDLRRTFATAADGLDISAYTLKALLNHTISSDDVTAGYVVTDIKRLRAAMQKITNYFLSVSGVRLTRVKDLKTAFPSQAAKVA